MALIINPNDNGPDVTEVLAKLERVEQFNTAFLATAKAFANLPEATQDQRDYVQGMLEGIVAAMGEV